ncbi:MAG: hypothetical protein AB7O37_08355 [Vicinamibacteria bacterium]
MRRLVLAASRAGFAASLALLALAAARFPPLSAQPPFSVPLALDLIPVALAFAVLGAICADGRARSRPTLALGAALGFALAALGLLAVTAWRGPVGLRPEVETPAGRWRGEPGTIAAIPGDLPAGEVLWAGELRAPQSGAYRIWAKGRGRVSLSIDGRSALEAEAERLDAGAPFALGRGTHRIEVRWQRSGDPELRVQGVRGHRLSVGWVKPRRNGQAGGDSQPLPARVLGEVTPLWTLSDALALVAGVSLGLLAWAVRWERPASLLADAPRSRAGLALSTIGLSAILAALSWPLMTDPSRLGVMDRVDAKLNAWILSWVGHALWHDPARLFDAPIFHPVKDALAFSENLLLPGLLAAPLTLAGEPVLAFNAVFLLSALASGLGVERLARRAGADAPGAFLAGALYAAGAHRWLLVAHLHAHVGLFLPFVALALDRFWQRRTLRAALAVAGLVAAQALASIYLGVLAAALTLVVVLLMLAGGLRGHELARLGLAAALAAVVLAPLAAPYFRVRAQQGVERGLADVEPHAATPSSYLSSVSTLWIGLSERRLEPDERPRALFPGLVPLLLGVAGLASAPRRFRCAALAVAGAGFVLSLGTATPLYAPLHELLLPLRAVRALYRFALLPVLALCLLAGLAVSRRPRLAALALALGLFEARPAALGLTRLEPSAPVLRALAARPGALAALPLGERDVELMLGLAPSFRPLVNGYSGITPRHYELLGEALEPADAPDALRFLRAAGVTELLSHDELALPLLLRAGDERVYAVPPGPAAEPPRPAEARPTLHAGEAVLVDLGRERRVARVCFRPAPGGWSRPRLLAAGEDAVFGEVPLEISLADAALSLAREPLAGRVELRFAPRRARYLRLVGARTGGEPLEAGE